MLGRLRKLKGFKLNALNGEIGTVDSFYFDDRHWVIRYLIVNTGNRWSGKKVLVSTQWIERVSWSEGKVFVNLSREIIKQSPEYTEEAQLIRGYELGLHHHYHRKGYWYDRLPDEVVISERHQATEALPASEARLRFLNNLTEATRALIDPGQIMGVISRMLGERLCASRCAFADVEPDGEQFTILHDYTDGCASTVGKYHLSLFGARAVSALHGGQLLVVRDVNTELLPDDGADMFNAIGIQAIIACPLVKAGSLRAIMAVHQTIPRDWTPSEISLVQEVVERCWATIERRRAEESLRDSEKLFSGAFENGGRSRPRQAGLHRHRTGFIDFARDLGGGTRTVKI